MSKEKVVHKITPPSRVAPVKLSSIVLCSTAKRTDILVSKSINHVTCPDCWKLWHEGIYV